MPGQSVRHTPGHSHPRQTEMLTGSQDSRRVKSEPLSTGSHGMRVNVEEEGHPGWGSGLPPRGGTVEPTQAPVWRGRQDRGQRVSAGAVGRKARGVLLRLCICLP